MVSFLRKKDNDEPLLPRSQSQPVAPDARTRIRSESDPARRLQSMIEHGTSVLNRGLGALRTRHVEPEVRGSWCSPAAVLMFVGVLVTVPLALSIELSRTRAYDESFFKTDPNAFSSGLSHLAAIPVVCTAVNFILHHIRQTTFWWESSKVSNTCCGFDPLARWPMVLAVLGLLRGACLHLVNEVAADHIAFYIQCLISMICLSLYYALLDQINAIIKGMAQEQEVINNTAPVKKMQNLVRNITRSGRPEKDAVYCFANTNTVPAEVLSYVWWLYYIVGKVLGAGLVLAVFIGVQNSLISHFLVGGLALSAATASGFMFEVGPNTLSLFRLSLNKPFYVGDLVTLNSNGAMDTGATSIMGFVENITMMYVVIRNFEMKQTWIPHRTFSDLIIQNWTRRPTKTVLLNIGISCRCPVKKVEQLVGFGKRWIEESPEIQQTNYRKCHITKTGNGYNIEVIFFPAIGVSHRGIRQKFLVAFMAAAERMQIPFVPLQINQNFCDENATTAANDLSEMFVKAGMCEDLMPDPNDLLPKGVGLGFREFPTSQPNFQEAAAPLSPVRTYEADMLPDLEALLASPVLRRP